MRPHTGMALLTLTLILGSGPGLHADEDAAPGGAVDDRERDEAITRGLAWLDQNLWRLPNARGTPRKQFTAAATGLVFLLAADARGLPTERRGDMVGRARTYVLEYLDEVERRSRIDAELPPKHGLATTESLAQYTWPTAMIGWFLTELHLRGRDRKQSARDVDRVVKILKDAQQPNGGWGHGRVRKGRVPPERVGGYPADLLASSILVTSALGVARTALEPEGLDYLERTPHYFRRAILSNGNFPYDPRQRSAHIDRTGAGRTAGAVFALWAVGEPFTSPTMKQAIRYLDAHLEDVAEGHASAVMTLLYGALAARVRGDRTWALFKEAFFRRILAHQQEDGRFECIAEGHLFATTNDTKPFGGRKVGLAMFQDTTDAYVTALHTWILLMDLAKPRTMQKTPSPRRSPVTPR